MIHNFLLIVLGVLSVMSLLCLLRLVLGPAAADRLLAVNMLGGMVISAIAVLSLLLKEAYLLDISFIYALISFLAVVVLAQIYIGASRMRYRHPKDSTAGKKFMDTVSSRMQSGYSEHNPAGKETQDIAASGKEDGLNQWNTAGEEGI